MALAGKATKKPKAGASKSATKKAIKAVEHEKLIVDPEKDQWALPSLMAETNGGGSVEKVPGFDVFRAATAGFETRRVAGPTTLLARPDGGFFSEGAIQPPLPGRTLAAPPLGSSLAKPENVLGVDSRVMVTDTAMTPWRCICHLEIEFEAGPVGFGTGFLIGPKAVLTAAHVICNPEKNRQARRVRVIPGRNGAIAPYGFFTADYSQCQMPDLWRKKGGRPEAAAADYAVILADEKEFTTEHKLTGQRLGYFGLKCLDGKADEAKAQMLFVNNAGYPYEADKPYGSLWYNAGRIKKLTGEFVEYMVDTEGGQSGSPVYFFDEEKKQRYVIAVHTTGDFVNRGLRITREVFAQVREWAEL